MEANPLQAKDLRIGNVLHYTTAENDVLETTIDWQDLKWISEDPKGFNLAHDPIPLSEDRLLELGFEIEIYGNIKYAYFGNNPITQDSMIKLVNTGDCWFCRNAHFKIEFVHQLQNLYHSLKGEELTIKE